MPQTYYTLLTAAGAADWVNGQTFGVKVPLTHIAVGNGSGAPVMPTENAGALVNEIFRAPITGIAADPDNPDWLVIDTVIPAHVGGWTIREIGLIGGLNADDISATPTTPGAKLLAYGNFPETYKPVVSEGAAKDLAIRMIIQVSNAAAVSLTVDPSVAVATNESVAKAIAAHRRENEPHPDRYAPCAHLSDANAHSGLFSGKAEQSALDDHINNTKNPHEVTPGKIGTMTVVEIKAAIAAALDGIDTGPDPAVSAPPMDGTSSVGDSTRYAREDHRHASDTSRMTAAQVSSAISAAISSLSAGFAPNTAFVASVGYGLEWPYTGPYGIRFTRANGSTVDVKIGDQSNPN